MRIIASSPQGLVRQRELQATQQAWIQLGADFDGQDVGDYFGDAVTMSSDGTVLAVGAPYGFPGYVQVFKYASSKWTQLGADINGVPAGDGVGHAVSLSGDGTVLAVGALYSGESKSGCVRVYKYANSKWTQRGADINGKADYDFLGHSVDLSSDGTVLAVGASGSDVNGDNSGQVQVYKYANNIWTQMGTDINGEAAGDGSGANASVSLSSDGTVLAVGAFGNDGTNGSNSGHVRVYTYANSQWTQLGADIDGEAAGDESWSVSLSSNGTVVAVGADYNSGSPGIRSGHVRVYQFANNAWTQLGADIDGEAAYDGSGWSLSLSSDGTVLAVGASMNDGNGDNSGHVRVYKYANSKWTQLGVDIDGEAAGDGFGESVSLSSDGTVLAVGAYANDGTNGFYDSGHVRVYKFTTTTPSTPQPTNKPTKVSTNKPTTKTPTTKPTIKPTSKKPTNKPTTKSPTNKPTTKSPTNKPTSKKPTNKPTKAN